jgi:hypothetical protein
MYLYTMNSALFTQDSFDSPLSFVLHIRILEFIFPFWWIMTMTFRGDIINSVECFYYYSHFHNRYSAEPWMWKFFAFLWYFSLAFIWCLFCMLLLCQHCLSDPRDFWRYIQDLLSVRSGHVQISIIWFPALL